MTDERPDPKQVERNLIEEMFKCYMIVFARWDG